MCLCSLHCVLHIKPVFLLVDIQHTQVSALILHFREMKALWSQNYDTSSDVVDGGSTIAMPCRSAGL